jgi:hypothetical protein
MARILTVAAVLCLALAAAAPAAQAARPAGHVWATIDECKLSGADAAVGVLAWMPAETARRPMDRFARIQLQYRTARGRWVAWPEAETAAIALGDRPHPAYAGYSFVLARGAAAATVRAHVIFTWRRGRVTRVRRSALSTARRPTGRFGRPARYSVAACRI